MVCVDRIAHFVRPPKVDVSESLNKLCFFLSILGSQQPRRVWPLNVLNRPHLKMQQDI